MSGELAVAIVGGIATIAVGALAYFGAKVQSRSQAKTAEVSVGASSLEAAVREWRAIADSAKSDAARAEAKADEALRRSAAAEYEARVARELNERLEMDVLALVGYLRAMWAGFINGTVPPRLPIPERLKHILSDADFPSPRSDPSKD